MLVVVRRRRRWRRGHVYAVQLTFRPLRAQLAVRPAGGVLVCRKIVMFLCRAPC